MYGGNTRAVKTGEKKKKIGAAEWVDCWFAPLGR